MSVEDGGGREQDQQPKQIDAPKVEVVAPRELDLDTARVILQAIVNTHESTITDTTPIDRIAGYSLEQVREAERVVAQSLMDAHGTATYLGNTVIRKDTPQGKLELMTENNEIKGRGIILMLRTKIGAPGTKYGTVLQNLFAFEQPHQAFAIHYGFEDNRIGQRGNLLKGASLENIRAMQRGLRWMNANMLDWDNPNTIMPEQLDTVSGSPSQEIP